MKTQTKTKIIIAFLCIFFLSGTVKAGTINIFEDQTDAYAEVTYDPDPVLDPGTTRDSFSGSLFPAGIFSGFNLNGDRSATLAYDTTSYSSRNNFEPSFGYYTNSIIIGTGEGSQYGATGLASAETVMNIGFSVSGSDSTINLMVTAEGLVNVWLTLYDVTDSLTVEGLSLMNTWDHVSVHDIGLIDSHTYTLAGYIYGETPLSGDPSGNFGFIFQDSDITSSVPEPSTLLLFATGIVGLVGIGRRRKDKQVL